MSEIRDVYSRITGKIIADLEQGSRPWHRPWNAEHAAGRITRPLRHNGIPYKGINVVMLWSAAVTKGYACPLWLTFKQAIELGGHVRKGETGELVVRGPQVMGGYWNAPAETAGAIRDGWLFTGDVGRMDGDGFFFLVDRKKDMINVGGLNVYPREIEEPLRQHPAVRQAAVVGVKRPIRGETIVAYVVPREPVTDPGPLRTELREFLRARIPDYKMPRRITVVDEIPTTLIGKPLRRILREDAARHAADARDEPPADAPA